ncbi:gephyrin-like molybdotransferase Glp [Marinoscillum sp.]|uniref:molybdopterin molybdotransferase MoeA n=1 Tax=Marinoscillum sp. TaxID=2024838 RepID=UPI003BAA1CC7
MVSIEEAFEYIAAQRPVRVKQHVQVSEAVGLHLADVVVSPMDIPVFDNSAMDGYALCGASDTYQIIGEVAAGSQSELTLEQGQAARIFTGARVPKGTTAVIMQEKTNVEGNVLTLSEIPAAGTNLRLRGEEIRQGQEVFQVGHCVNAATVGMLLTLGMTSVSVYARPRVGVLVTGNELVEAGEPLGEGQIYESNGGSLQAALRQLPVDITAVRRVTDNFEATSRAIGDLLGEVDVLLISGGISVGDYDFVKEALAQNDVEEIFYKVNQKPGKPLFFGRRENQFVYALPGNPASSLTCFYLYVTPLIYQFLGRSSRTREKVNLGHDFEVRGTRPTFYRAKVEPEHATILDKQSSSMLHSFAMGNALVFLPPGTHNKGAEVFVWYY